MTEREYLYTAATALLVIALLRHTSFFQPGSTQSNTKTGANDRAPMAKRPVTRQEIIGLAMMVLGSLIPLFDPAIAYLSSTDRIEFLVHAPGFSGLYYGLAPLAFITGVMCFLMPFSEAFRYGLYGAAGLWLHQLLMLLTPVGVPLLAPFYPFRFSLPVLPTGHPILLLFLGLGALLSELLPRHGRKIIIATTTLIGLYMAMGLGATVYVMVQSSHLREKGNIVHIQPDNIWLSRWLVIEESHLDYEVRRFFIWDKLPATGTRLERWNNQENLLKLMGDPVVNHFYNHLFRHPVARVETTNAQITLFINEVNDLSPRVPGRTFYVESNLDGGNRFYQLQRFQ